MTTGVDLWFPGVLMDTPRVRSATLTQNALSHDVLSVRVAPGQSFGVIADSAPVRFTWRSSRGPGSFWGYVHRIDPRFSAADGNSEILCVGTTSPLMSVGDNVWSEVRASDVVLDIARRFRLSCDTEDHPRVYNQISQAGESYWQLLVRLAKETGWVLRVDSATIRFRSRESMTRGLRPHAPIFRYDPAPNAVSDVSSFVPKVGVYTPETGARQTGLVDAIDPMTGAIIGASSSVFRLREGTPQPTGPTTESVVRSAIEAESTAQAARENSRFSLRARMESVGDPLIRPESFVDIRGEVARDMAGLWVVRKAVHEITPSSYTCSSELGTDGLGPQRPLVGELEIKRNEVNPHRPGALPPENQPVLVDNRTVLGSGGGPQEGVYWTSSVINWRK